MDSSLVLALEEYLCDMITIGQMQEKIDQCYPNCMINYPNKEAWNSILTLVFLLKTENELLERINNNLKRGNYDR